MRAAVQRRKTTSGSITTGRVCIPSLLSLVLSLVLGSCHPTSEYAPRNGDVIFQTSRSSQSTAIQRATHSRYSHMGIVYVETGAAFVFEAVQTVKLTPLAQWTQRGERGHFVVKRLRDADERLTPDRLRALKAEGRRLAGTSYDPYFEWSDERIYCSELVWKMFKRALDVEIGRTQHLADFDLSDPVVKAKARERWHGSPPSDEVVISPAAIFASDRLVTVFTG